MPVAQYVDVVNNIRLTKDMVTPKRITKLRAWFNGARKVIPEIPNPANMEWLIDIEEAYRDYIRFELRHIQTNARKHVVILRSQGGFK